MRSISVVALALLLTGCSAAAAAPRTTATVTEGQVHAMLTDMKIAVDTPRTAAGPVTFVVRNDGTVVHQLDIIRTDLAADRLPPNAADPALVDETGSAGKSGEIKPGEVESLIVVLPAGRYVLVCNIEGHYLAGMRLAFTVY
jgi:uncharacterized cupredoxin-like copper-binding protein